MGISELVALHVLSRVRSGFELELRSASFKVCTSVICQNTVQFQFSHEQCRRASDLSIILIEDLPQPLFQYWVTCAIAQEISRITSHTLYV